MNACFRSAPVSTPGQHILKTIATPLPNTTQRERQPLVKPEMARMLIQPDCRTAPQSQLLGTCAEINRKVKHMSSTLMPH